MALTPFCCTTIVAHSFANRSDVRMLVVSRYLATIAAKNVSPAPERSFISTLLTGNISPR